MGCLCGKGSGGRRGIRGWRHQVVQSKLGEEQFWQRYEVEQKAAFPLGLQCRGNRDCFGRCVRQG